MQAKGKSQWASSLRQVRKVLNGPSQSHHRAKKTCTQWRWYKCVWWLRWWRWWKRKIKLTASPVNQLLPKFNDKISAFQPSSSPPDCWLMMMLTLREETWAKPLRYLKATKTFMIWLLIKPAVIVRLLHEVKRQIYFPSLYFSIFFDDICELYVYYGSRLQR